MVDRAKTGSVKHLTTEVHAAPKAVPGRQPFVVVSHRTLSAGKSDVCRQRSEWGSPLQDPRAKLDQSGSSGMTRRGGPRLCDPGRLAAPSACASFSRRRQ